MNKFLVILFLMACSVVSFAHEGHDLSPGVFKALHGGVVKVGKQFNIEYLVNGAEVIIYVVSHDGKDLDPSQVQLAAKGHLPKAKDENLNLEKSGKFFTFKADLKKAHRMEVNITATFEGKTDKFKFQVEK